jgi:magnesium transporter
MTSETIEMPRPELPPEAGARIRILFRDVTGEMHLDWSVESLEASIRDRSGTLWVDIEDPEANSTEEAEALLRNVFGFHTLAVEDALRESNLPKIDDWDEYIYLVFHAASIDPRTDGLRLHELDVFLGPNYLVTYHTEPLSFLEEDRRAIERDPHDRMQHGPDHLLFRLLERAVDQSLGAIEHLDDRIDQIQNRVIENPRPGTLNVIFRVKRAAIRLHKIFGPQREVLNRLARDPYKPVQAKHRVYFRDVYDHVVRIHDISESLRDLIAGTLETYLSVMSNRTNDIMKTLTLVTVMFMPMSFLVGFFGMNFFGETLAFQTPLPKAFLFTASLVTMIVSPSLMWIYVKRRNWF